MLLGAIEHLQRLASQFRRTIPGDLHEICVVLLQLAIIDLPACPNAKRALQWWRER
jgi:hypothetical protein